MQKIPYKTYGLMIGVLAMTAFAQDSPTALRRPLLRRNRRRRTEVGGALETRIRPRMLNDDTTTAPPVQPANQPDPQPPQQPVQQNAQPAIPPQLTIKPGMLRDGSPEQLFELG